MLGYNTTIVMNISPPTTTLLEMLDLFAGLPQEAYARITPRIHRRIFPEGSTIMTAQQPGEAVYFIVKGTLKVHVPQPDGNDVILAILGPGDVVGEMSLIDQIERSANVLTQEESILLWMDRAAFQECLETIPKLSQNMIRILSRRVRAADEHIQALAALDVYGRIACQLLSFARRYGLRQSDESVMIPMRLTQGDLADLVGASRKRVNQVIGTCRQQGLISIDARGYITLHKPDELRRACGGTSSS